MNSGLNTPSPPRVAVVGGGIGGMACARELRVHGCDPVVFEAGDRPGGRCSPRQEQHPDMGLHPAILPSTIEPSWRPLIRQRNALTGKL